MTTARWTSLRRQFAPPISEAPWARRREAWASAIGVAFTLLATSLVALEQVPILRTELADGAWRQASGHALFLVVAGLLVYGGLVYQITRLLYARRRRLHARKASQNRPLKPAQLCILVPSYNEQRAVMEQTLLSAALQEWPGLRVILLIDNPPQPLTQGDRELLETARQLPRELQRRFDQIADHVRRISDDRAAAEHAAQWLEAEADRWLSGADLSDSPHTHRFFVCEILLDRALRLRNEAACGKVDRARLHAMFDAQFSAFERKTFPNLSHEANKAMNLNSYIGLIGRRWAVEAKTGILREVEATDAADLVIPPTDFIIALDADSVILPAYAETLLAQMQATGNEHLAVCQTPYSAIPGAQGSLERLAGATTDVQYIIHQGFTAWSGTYWVGANAMMRFTALQDIAESDTERGYTITRFIQDRTVIEDTESSIDLASRGWTLLNVPERLAFSATPPDFGSLLIQRRRWSNGGLLILPKAVRHLAARFRHSPMAAMAEAFMRIHYLVSITTVNFGLVLLLAYPITSSVGTFWLPLTAVPYFWLYGRDLRLMGYERLDLLRVYALNLLLIPVHIGGVLQSVRQGIRQTKLPFSRTPKVGQRTRVSPPYVAVTWFLIGQWTTGAVWDFYNGFPSHGVFSALNAIIMAYAVSIFMGWRESWADF